MHETNAIYVTLPFPSGLLTNSSSVRSGRVTHAPHDGCACALDGIKTVREGQIDKAVLGEEYPRTYYAENYVQRLYIVQHPKGPPARSQGPEGP